MNTAQQRKFSRIPFPRKVTLSFASQSYGPCQIKDLSVGGMFIYGDFDLDKGEPCQLTFRLSPELAIQSSAVVVRVEKNGLAIEFTSMEFDCYMYLQTTLLYESEDPYAISQEFPEELPFELTKLNSEKSTQIIQLYNDDVL